MNQLNKFFPQLKYRSDIDGLRALAVLAVVIHHLSAKLIPGGYVGVDVFFVISGYLITGIISREIAEGHFTFRRFYQRRVRRIFPALFVVMSLTMVVGYLVLLPSDYASTLRAVLGTIFFSSNMVFWREMSGGYFAATDSMLNPLLHTWSLGVEEQFYLFFPVLLLLCYRYFRKYIVWILVLGALLTLISSAILVNFKSVAMFFLTPFRAWELLAGALLAYNVLPEPRNQMQRELLAGFGLLAILVACFIYSDKTTFPGFSALVPVLGAAAFIYAGSSGSTFSGRLLQLRPIVYIGLISYSLYLWHWPVIVFTEYTIGVNHLTSHLIAIFFVSLLLASLSYHFIEQPFRNSGTVTRKALFTSATVFSLVLAIVSAVGLMKDGFAKRFDPIVIKFDQARAPNIPFVECNIRNDGQWCQIGSSITSPTVLVWGDSHSLAWGPALEAVMKENGTRAIFAPASACPPLLGVDVAVNPTCNAHNDAIRNYLVLHPEITTVIMAAYWSTYYRESGPLSMHSDPTVRAASAANQALTSTLRWLKDSGKRVMLIGPVPVYDKSIPEVLAKDAAFSRGLLYTTAVEQRRKHASFFGVVDSIVPSPDFQFLNPIDWMCAEKCKLMEDGIPLYRDSHHLSVAGAMALKPQLDNALKSSVLVY